jgi:hypothetical protein
MRFLLPAVLVIATGLVVPASARQTPAAKDPLATAKSLRCSFPNYAAVRWVGMAGEVLGGKQDFSFQIDSFDFRRNRAQLVGATSMPVTLLVTPTGLSVIEQTPAGNLTVTTVFSGTASEDKTYQAVHSRHLGKETDLPARASQAYGSCVLQ